MSSKIEVPRELAEYAAALLEQHCQGNVSNELRTLLAAPVVERQPVAREFIESVRVTPSKPLKHPMLANAWGDGVDDTVTALISMLAAAPPELAELQATIARLTAENERLRHGMKGDYDLDAWLDWAKEAETLRAEIKRLKGGQGEPVAWGTMQPEFHDDERTLITDKAYAEVYDRQCYTLTPLFASQPAPVSVPDGWKLVPKVATLEMKNAGWQECERQGIDPESVEMQTIWTAMHLNAPTASTRSRS